MKPSLWAPDDWSGLKPVVFVTHHDKIDGDVVEIKIGLPWGNHKYMPRLLELFGNESTKPEVASG
jgi:hypothetical protein